MAKGEDSLSAAAQSKKKRIEDEPKLEDVSAKPLQLQRRRVWRACESCRSAPCVSVFAMLTFFPGARRSSATDASRRARNVPRRAHSALGCRQRTGPLLADSQFRQFLSSHPSDRHIVAMSKNWRPVCSTWNLCSPRWHRFSNSRSNRHPPGSPMASLPPPQTPWAQQQPCFARLPQRWKAPQAPRCRRPRRPHPLRQPRLPTRRSANSSDNLHWTSTATCDG